MAALLRVEDSPSKTYFLVSALWRRVARNVTSSNATSFRSYAAILSYGLIGV